MMLPAWIVAVVYVLAAAGLIFEAGQKEQMNTPLYRLRWAFMSLPFLWQGIVYVIIQFANPDNDWKANWGRWGNFGVAFPVAVYFVWTVGKPLIVKIRIFLDRIIPWTKL